MTATPSETHEAALSDERLRDEALTLAKDEGADFVLTELGRALNCEWWTQHDGSETWDGDVHATLMHLLWDAGVLDRETNAPLFTGEVVGALEWIKVNAPNDSQSEEAETPFGGYIITADPFTYSPTPAYYVDGPNWFKAQCVSVPEAKAVAQANFDQRVRSVLARRNQPSAGEVVASDPATLSFGDTGMSYGLTMEQGRRALTAALTPATIPDAISAAIKGMRVLRTMLSAAGLAGADVADEVLAGLMALGRDPAATPPDQSKRVERLEAALKPFADVAADLPEHIHDMVPVVLTTDADDNPAEFVHIGDFRAARQALHGDRS